MKLFSKRNTPEPAAVSSPCVTAAHPFSALNSYTPLSVSQLSLYDSLREAVPVIDAAISKLVRLIGTFTVECSDDIVDSKLKRFVRDVRVGANARGMNQFVYTYFDQLLTYGTAVGETVLTSDKRSVYSLYNASLKDVDIIRGENPLEVYVCPKGSSFKGEIPAQSLISLSFLNPTPGEPKGVSVMRSLPFVSSILLKIFQCVGQNFDRVGNVRFAVTCKPSQGMSGMSSKQRAKEIADEWSRAMRESERVCDFVSVGDVSIKAIGADNQILDCDVPLRHITEQIVAKLSIPPFMLGLSWSTTERMSTQQADILMSELEYYRSLLTPVIMGICETFLTLEGCPRDIRVSWSEIQLQDETEAAQARLQNAQASQLEAEVERIENRNTDQDE